MPKDRALVDPKKAKATVDCVRDWFSHRWSHHAVRYITLSYKMHKSQREE